MPRSGIECYNECMEILSASHTRYNIQYHFVWIVKYRKNLLYDNGRQKKLREIISEIGERYWFVVVSLATDGNHVHLFLRAAPRYAPAKIMNLVKGISAREMFKVFPEVKKVLWGGELWGDGYYVGTVGDGVTVDIIKQYIEKQGKATGHKSFDQLKLF